MSFHASSPSSAEAFRRVTSRREPRVERHIFDLEAELNWLDHIESGAVSEAARRAAFAAAKGRSMGWAQAEASISERAGVR